MGAAESRRMGTAHAGPELNRRATAAHQPSRPAGTNTNSAALESRGGRHPLGPGQTVGTAGRQATERGAAVDHNERASNHARAEHAAPILRNPVFAHNVQARGTSRTSPAQFTFRGHFAQSGWDRDRHHHHHFAGIVLGFAGPLFWPYAYDDFVDYTFAPYAYDTFWPYAFDDVYTGIFGGYAPEYYGADEAYAYAGSPASQEVYARSSARMANANTGGGGGNARICSGQAEGVTDFSIQKIAEQVNPDQQQQRLLDDLKAATIEAVKVMQAACPDELPSTPTGRLDAMLTRVDAMLKAVQIVRPALDKFYESLSDEQREHFNALDEAVQARNQQPELLTRLCNAQAPHGPALPIDRIERTLNLNAEQEADLKALDDATAKAADILQTKCQPAQTLTPTGRLAAMEDRLSAMADALRTTQAALTKFYGALNDEQKARFDRLNVRAA
jgi:hypothetical protein